MRASEPAAPGSDEEAALVALRSGGVVGLPTDTVYGLAVLPALPDALEELFALKGRPEAVAVAVLVADASQALALAADPDGGLGRLAEAFWPGPLTVVARRAAGVDYPLGGDPASIGLRCPDDALVRRLAASLGPLAVTSANLHGEPPITDAGVLRRTFPGIVVVDGGVRDGQPSTVVSLLDALPEVLREGPIGARALSEALSGDGARS